MVQFFPNTNAANDFMQRHQELRPVSVSVGHSAGSVLVLFEAKPVAYDQTLRIPLVKGLGQVATSCIVFADPPLGNPMPITDKSAPKRRAAPKGKA